MHTSRNINFSLSYLEIFWKRSYPIQQWFLRLLICVIIRSVYGIMNIIMPIIIHYRTGKADSMLTTQYVEPHDVGNASAQLFLIIYLLYLYLFRFETYLYLIGLLRWKKKQGEMSIIFSAILDWPVSLPCVWQVERYSLAGQDCVMKFLLKFDLNATILLRRCSFYSYPVV